MGVAWWGGVRLKPQSFIRLSVTMPLRFLELSEGDILNPGLRELATV